MKLLKLVPDDTNIKFLRWRVPFYIVSCMLIAASLALVRSIIGLGHGLGMKVVAEGVEREDQLGILRRLGCDSFQGFYYAEPMPAPEFERWLAGVRAFAGPG